MADREQFLSGIRAALASAPSRDSSPASHAQPADVREQAGQPQAHSPETRETLLAQLERSAALQGWNVVIAASPEEAAARVVEIARQHGAGTVVRTAHEALERMSLDAALQNAGMKSVLLAEGPSELDAQQRLDVAASAEVGVTGVDAVIAETASVALAPRRGMSRQASLLPPVHVAVVELGQVLPSLDELFALLRERFGEGDFESYMNIITGPSRSADIEYQLVTGVHGPGEVHMVIVG